MAGRGRAAAAACVAALMLLVACGPGGTPSAAATAHPVSAGSAGAPTAGTNGSPANAPGLTGIWMVSAADGWATGPAGIYHTSDGGRRWQDVTPAGVGLSSGHPAFLGDAAWVFSAQACSVFATTDGGAHWSHSAPLVPADAGTLSRLQCTLPVEMAFSNGQSGLLGFGPPAMQMAMTALYATTDGGTSWHLVTRTPPVLMFASLGAALFAGDSPDPGGQYTPGPAPGIPWLSSDGGGNWSVAPVRYPTAVHLGAPGVMPVQIVGAGSAGGTALIAMTYGQSLWLERVGDGGSLWTAPGPTLPLTGTPRVSVVSASAAFVLMAGTLSATLDGGAAWTRVAARPALAAGDRISFVSATQGWALDPTARTLWTTTDGGRLWTALPYRLTGTAP